MRRFTPVLTVGLLLLMGLFICVATLDSTPDIATWNPILPPGIPDLATWNPILPPGIPDIATWNPILPPGIPDLATWNPILPPGIPDNLRA